MELDDITGRRFGKLIVIEYVGNSKWKCKCDCGNDTIVLAENLKKGHTKSCGCLKGTGLIGKKIGRLTVIEEVENKKYKCICECGTICVRNYGTLVSKNPKGCDKCVSEHLTKTLKESDTFVENTQPSHLHCKITKNNKSGVVGVNWDKSRNKWQASIRFKGKKINIGRFSDFEEAVAARKEKEKEIFEPFLKHLEIKKTIDRNDLEKNKK